MLTINTDHIKVLTSAGFEVPIRLQAAIDGLSVEVMPLTDYEAGDYTLKALEGIADMSGQTQPQDLEIAFTVAGDAEPDALVITPNAVTVDPGQLVRFTAALSSATIAAGNPAGSAPSIARAAGATNASSAASIESVTSTAGADSNIFTWQVGSGDVAQPYAGSINNIGVYQAPLQPGQYYVQVGNNQFPALHATAVVTVRPTASLPVDFGVDATSLQAMNDTVRPGNFLLLKARVYNQTAGGAVAGGSVVRFLINGRIIDEVPFYLGEKQVFQDVTANYYLPMGEYADMLQNETAAAEVSAVVDPYNQIPETDENNNNARHSVTVLFRDDIAIEDTHPPLSVDATGLSVWSVKDDAPGDRVSAAQPGQRLHLKARINYNSSEASEDINVRFQVNGVVIFNDNRRASARSSGYFEVSCNYQVPFNRQAPLDFRVILSNGSTASLGIPVLAHDLAVRPGDLYWASSVVAVPGQYLYLRAILSNLASISFPSDNNRVAWRAMVDGQELAENDFVVRNNLLYLTLPAYKVPEDQTEPVQFTVVTDVYNQLSESDETNNIATIEIPLQNNGLLTPNFYVTADDLSCLATPILPGARVTLKATIHSQGASFPNQALEVDFKINGAVVAHKTIERMLLDPLQAQTVTYDWSAPPTLSGQANFAVVLDPNQKITEDSELDNTAALDLQVLPPDLDVTSPDLSWQPETPVTGEPVTLAATIKNTSAALVQNPVVRFYANDEPVGDSTLAQINGSSAATAAYTWQIPAVPAVDLPYQALSGVSGKLATPATVTRSWQIRVVADPDSLIAEGREDNNASPAATLTATVPMPTRFVYIHTEDDLDDVIGATVILTDQDGVTASVETGEDGWCCFTGVPLGRYSFAVARDGYVNYNSHGVTSDQSFAQSITVHLTRTDDSLGLTGPDRDKDYLSDADELLYGCDPDDPDSDDDGLIDGKDLSPTLNPANPVAEPLQKVGMVRFEQPVAAHGLDGWVDIYDMDFDLLSLSDTLVYSYTDYRSGTRQSTMNAKTYRQAVDRVFAGEKFKSWAIRDIAALSSRYKEKGSDLQAEDEYTFEADHLHRTEYRFKYDYLVDYQSVSLKNFEEILYPNADNYFTYLLFPVQVRVGADQSYTFQFMQAGLDDQIYNVDDSQYKEIGFQYTFYKSNDFDDDTNVPTETMVALADCPGQDVYSFTVNMPAEKALLPAYYLKITPVWVTGQNGSVKIDPLPLNWNLTALTRDVAYTRNPDGSGNILSQGLRSLADFNEAIPTYEAVLALENDPHTQVVEYATETLTYDPAAQAGEQYKLASMQLKILAYVNKTLNAARNSLTLVKYSNVIYYRADSVEALPATSIVRSPGFARLTQGLNAAAGLVTIYTNGQQAWKAYQEGDTITVVYYAAKATTGAGTTVQAFYKISTGTAARAGTTGRFACLTSKKFSVGLAVAVGVIEVSYNLYKYNTTTDPIKKAAYSEKLGSSMIDTSTAVAGVFVPHYVVFTATWLILAEIYGFFFDYDLAYRIAQTPGTAVIFIVNYWTEGIPSQFAETAYTNIVNVLCEYLRIMNENGVPFVPIFIDPQL